MSEDKSLSNSFRDCEASLKGNGLLSGAYQRLSSLKGRYFAGSRAAIAVLLAAVWGVVPLVFVLHVFFTGHEHRYCFEHQQVEAVEPSLPGLFSGYQELQRAGSQRFFAKGNRKQSIPQNHLACNSLNSDLSRKTLLPHTFQPTVGDTGPVNSAGSVADEMVSQGSILLFAPKNSPPSVC
jgi:hypothetical protein